MEYWWVGCEDRVLVCTLGSRTRWGHTCTTTSIACETGSSSTRCAVEVDEIFVWLEMCSQETEYRRR
eukprot:165870-Prorocentrum_lima.AAC.1